MAVIDVLNSSDWWQNYRDYKLGGGSLSKSETADLIEFVENEEYIPAVRAVLDGGFSPPVKKLVGKSGSSKKRTVYIFKREENYLLKLLTFYLSRKYDGVFSDSLYSFRAGSGVRKAVNEILRHPSAGNMYTYKADISNYFNSVDVTLLLGTLRSVLASDPEAYDIFERLLSDERAVYNGEIISESKGVMAGSPFSVFLANIYLMDMDSILSEKAAIYARYSDDIIVFAGSESEAEELRRLIAELLSAKGLLINHEKEAFTAPGEPWSFLGFSYEDGVIDVSAAALRKIEAKIRRRARSIKRWQVRKGASPEQGVKAFIRAVNKKFFYSRDKNDLTWSRWYFPVITTDKSLRLIDECVCRWARYVYTGKHTKANYSLRYETLCELGYISLVNAWYRQGK